ARANGRLSSINIPYLNLKWSDTELQAQGSLSNPTDMDLLEFDFPKVKAHTSRETLTKFVDESALGIQLPENFDLTASARGKINDATATMQLDTDFGNIALDGSFKNSDAISFNTELT